MRRTLARELPAQEPGSQVMVQGWVHRRRALATVTFVVVRDRTGPAQVVVEEEQALAQVAYVRPWGDIDFGWRTLEFSQGAQNSTADLRMSGPILTLRFRFGG